MPACASVARLKSCASTNDGAAFAQLFPQVTVGANGGLASPSLDNLFTTGAFTYGVSLLVSGALQVAFESVLVSQRSAALSTGSVSTRSWL